MSRMRAICSTVTVIVVITLVLLGRPFSSITPKVDAQASTHLVPLVTDQTPLALSNQFGVTQNSVVNQAGDYAFVGDGASAVFYRAAGAPSATRVMQMGDEVPGFPGSREDIFTQIRLNNSGLFAFRNDFFQTDGTGMGAIFTYDGITLTKVVSGDQPAPGAGTAFGRGLSLIGLNDSGDVAFTAPLIPSGSLSPAQTTLYILPAGGTPIRIAGLGDTATSGGGTFTTFVPVSLNNRGEVLFRANITSPSGALGLYVGSVAGGVRKVAAGGDVVGVVTLSGFVNAFLNNAGITAFQYGNAIYVNSDTGGNSRAAGTVDTVPPPVGGTIGSSPSLQAIGDGGDIVFTSNVAGTAVTGNGLFRVRAGNPVEVVSYRNQAAAGTAGQTFNTFAAISVNNTGTVSFRGALQAGSVPLGIYTQSGVGAPVNIALDAQATPLPGGGNYGLANILTTRVLDSGSVFFISDIPGGAAEYAEFISSGGSTTTLMSSVDTLPSGSRVVLRTFRIGGTGDFVGFLAQRTGGHLSLTEHNITTQATSILVTEGDIGPSTGGGRMRILAPNVLFLNSSGTVAFSARIIGGTANGNTGVFEANSTGTLSKIVVGGELDASGKTFSAPALNTVLPSPINDAGQVVFVTNLISGVTTTRGLFLGSPTASPAKIAATNETASDGRTITAFSGGNSFWINASGQVAFVATTTAGGSGIYVGAAGATPQKVVASGDAGPGATTFTSFAAPGFNDAGEVAFMAGLSGSSGGVFVGSTSAAPVAIAVNGAPAPSGGNFSITTARPDVLINNEHDLVFRALITGGTADSAYFIRRGAAGTLHAGVFQGQSAPGTSGGVFETISPTANILVGENFELGPDGDLAFQNFVVNGSSRKSSVFHLKTDDTIEEILVRGNVEPEFGGGSAVVSTSSVAWNSGGRFALFARITGGTFTDGIFLFVPVVETNTPAGTAVPVTVTDSTTGTSPVSLTFANVSAGGETTLTTASGGPAIPTAFALGDPPVFYNIETTATFSGSIGVCIDFSSVSFPAGSTLRLLHFQGGAWVDVTTSGPTGTVICGSVTSLSPFTVVQLLNSPPVARVRNITVAADASCVASVTAAQVDDGSSDPDSGDTISISLDSTGPFSLGPHQVTLTVTDSHNASSSATATVTVVDTTSPVITLNGGNMTVELGSVFNDPGATASDNCAGSVAVISSGSVNVNSVGTYAIQYDAHDPANNQATQVSRTVSVVDTTAPVVTAPGPSSANSDVNCQAAVPNLLPQVVASDLGGPVTLSQSPTAGTLVGVGPHTITITGKDPSNNSQSVTTTFTVVGGPTFTVSVNPTSVKRGKIVTLTTAFNNCASSSQALTLKVSLTKPGSNTLMVSLPLVLKAGQKGSLAVPIPILKSTPTGVYALTLDVYVGSVKIGSSTAQLTVIP